MLISPTDFWFFKEKPGLWKEEYVSSNYETMVKKIHEEISQSDGICSILD